MKLSMQITMNFKTWVFPNLFKIDDEVMDMLRSKVLRDGNVAIFGPASGITDGICISADGATRLLNVPMEIVPRTVGRRVLIQDSGHPITRELQANQTYGDSLKYGPVIVPGKWAVENSGGAGLGFASAGWYINRTGLFVKEEGLGAAGNGKAGDRGGDDYAVIWSIAMPMPANLLRSAARYAGSNIWCEENDVDFIFRIARNVRLDSLFGLTNRLCRFKKTKYRATGRGNSQLNTYAVPFHLRLDSR